MREIKRLHSMLVEAGIEHEWINRSLSVFFVSWQIIVRKPNGDRLVSVVEGFGTYGFEDDKLEIMGLLTPEEEEYDSVVGWLTAEDVFQRISAAITCSSD